MTASSAAGLLHSEILGSKRVCRSPGLIAAYRVLRRLAMPRHPPCALSRLCVSSNPPPRAPSRERAGTRGFASKPRARFDCLEIELLMSSHSNFSRLPLSKSRKSAWNRFFWSLGRIVASSLGRIVAWSHRRLVAWSHRRLVASSLGRMVASSLGRIVAWSHRRLVASSDHSTIRPSDHSTIRPFDHRTVVGGRDWS